MHIAHSDMSLPSGGDRLLTGLSLHLYQQQVALAAAFSVAFPLELECQNLETAAVIQAGPHHGLTRSLRLQ